MTERDAGALDRYWDALVSGAAPDPSSVTPARAETLRRFHAAGDVPGVDPVFRDQLRATLVADGPGREWLPAGPAVRPDLNGRLALEAIPALLPRRGASRPRWALTDLATAALVLLTLLGSLVALRGPLRLTGQEEEPASIPAIDGPAETVTLMDALVTEWPAADPLLWASLRRETFDPGAVEEFGIAGSTGEGIDLFTVESGQITVDADGPLILWRAPATPGAEPATLPDGSTVVLGAGDQLFVPSGAPFRRRNDGAEPAVIFGFQVTQQEVTHYPAGVTNLRIMPDKVLNTTLPAPVEISLHRLRLRPGTSLSILDLPGVQMLYVEEGTLDLRGARRLGDLEPESWAAIPPGQGMAHFETTTGMENRGSEPVTFLVVTFNSAQ